MSIEGETLVSMRADLAIAEMAILRWYRAHVARQGDGGVDFDEVIAATTELRKLGEGIEATRREQGLT
jgi:hypothetical protein